MWAPDVPSPRAGGGLLLVTPPPEATSLVLTAVFGILGRDDSEASVTCFIWLRRRDSTSGPPTMGSTSWKLKRTEGRLSTLDPLVGFTAWLCVVCASTREFEGNFKKAVLCKLVWLTSWWFIRLNPKFPKEHLFYLFPGILSLSQIFAVSSSRKVTAFLCHLFCML